MSARDGRCWNCGQGCRAAGRVSAENDDGFGGVESLCSLACATKMLHRIGQRVAKAEAEVGIPRVAAPVPPPDEGPPWLRVVRLGISCASLLAAIGMVMGPCS